MDKKTTAKLKDLPLSLIWTVHELVGASYYLCALALT
jgi:hypothetical protein